MDGTGYLVFERGTPGQADGAVNKVFLLPHTLRHSLFPLFPPPGPPSLGHGKAASTLSSHREPALMEPGCPRTGLFRKEEQEPRSSTVGPRLLSAEVSPG